MAADRPTLETTAEQLRAETSVPGLLAATARAFVDVLGAQACTISRVIGDLLVDLHQHSRVRKTDRLGHGYLISDFPLTRTVIEEGDARSVFLGDPNADPAEARLLRELGYDSLVMIAVGGADGAWGLVEVYDTGRRFDDGDVALVRRLAAEVSDALARLERPS